MKVGVGDRTTRVRVAVGERVGSGVRVGKGETLMIYHLLRLLPRSNQTGDDQTHNDDRSHNN